jgi:formylglycine-generating enzyme required for sulfatase activity
MLDAGKRQGVFEGQKLRFVRIDSLVVNPMNGRVLETRYDTLAELTVEEVADLYSWARINKRNPSVEMHLGDRAELSSVRVLDDVLQGATFVLIPAGSFWMGSKNGNDDEIPVHHVTLSGFYIMTTEVTQGQWMRVMGLNPSQTQGAEFPVEGFDFDHAEEFCKKLSAINRMYKFRLPTEAEWEYACRAGSQTEYCFGDFEPDLGNYGWYLENSHGKINPVGRLLPNAWGLYDMHGNVRELCVDRYSKTYYARSSAHDPVNPVKGYERVVRGGSCSDRPANLRSASRKSLNTRSAARVLSNPLRKVGLRVILQFDDRP